MTGKERRDPRDRWRLIAASVGLHLLVVAVALVLPARLFPIPDKPETVDVVFYDPDTVPPPPIQQEIPQPEAVVPEPVPQPEQQVEPPAPAPPRPEPVAPPQPRPEPRVARPEPPRPAPAPPEPQPARPKPEVKTNVFAQEEPRPSTQRAPSRQTRSAGFATADAAQPTTTARVRTTAAVGSFEVAAARSDRPTTTDREVASTGFDENAEPSEAPSPPGERRAVADTSFGETTTDTPSQPSRPRGPVSSTGFTGEAPASSSSATRTPNGSVKQGQFGDGFAIAHAPSSRKRPAENPDTPVEIVSKPRPAYTSEARSRKVEGEVVLEVIFNASGQLKVLRVLGSLGHGLDEAAVEAAKRIRFKPARRDGQAIDYTALLTIVFQLA